MKCRTCVHYKPIAASVDSAEHGECESPKFVKGYHAAFAPHDYDEWWQPMSPDGVHVENDEGWGFHVGPNFGCVHWASATKN